jgi:PAS domain S-box-containing protein
MNAFQAILQNASFGYAYHKIILDSNGIPCDFEFEFVNDAFLNITGLNRNDVSGKRVTEVFPDIQKDEFKWIDFYGEIALTQKSQEIEQFSLSMKKWLKITATSDKKHYFSTLMTDVSDQYLLIDAVNQLQEYTLENIDYKEITQTLKLFSGAQYAVFNQFDTGTKNFTTKAICGPGNKLEKITRMLGFKIEGKQWKQDTNREKLTEGRKITVFKKFSDLTHDSLPVSLVNALAKTFQIKASVIIKIEKDKKPLGDFTLFFDKNPDPSKLKKTEHFADSVAMLISRLEDEKSIAENKLHIQSQSALLKSLLNSIPDQIAYKDNQGRYLGCNPQFEKFTGKPTSQILGKTDYDLFDHETAEFFQENDRRARLIAGPRKNEEWVTYPDGSKILFETIKTPFKGPDGSVMGILGISRDITDRSAAEEKIRKLSMAVHQSPVSIVITNTDGNIEYVNPRFCIATGYSYKEAIGQNPRILKSGVFSTEHYEELWKTISGGKQWRGEMHNKKKNGELFWEFASISPLKNPEGEITHYIAVKEDITERKATEEKIHQSEMFQRALLENLAVGVMIIDPETRVIKRVNPYAAKLIGADPEEITGRVCHQFICPAMEKSCPICDKNQIVDNSDKILIRADGSQTPILKTVKVINLKGKDVLLESFVDISDKKKAEEALKRNQELLQSVLQSQKELICRFHTDTTLTYVNQSYARFFGMKPNEMIGKRWLDLVPGNNHESIKKHLKNLIKKGANHIVFEHEVRLDNGTNRWVQWTDYVVRDQNGKFLEFQSVGNDVTDLKEREKLEKEVEISRNTLRFKQNFLASMSHEMRTPLTGIMGTTQLLEKTSLSENQQDFVSILKQSSENLSAIIDQVLDYSRLEAGNIQLHLDNHTLFDIEKKSSQLFDSLCNKPVVFKTYIDPSIPRLLKYDKKRILQNINNLLINAIKFTEQGEVSLRITKKRGGNNNPESLILKVEMSDTGIGIRDEKKQTIFSPFSQVHQIESENYSGIGLGLAICKEIAELHGGETGITSKPGKGTKVWFTFKALLSEYFQEEQNSMTAKQPKELNILFIEDNRTTQKLVKLMLNGLGYRVSLADNGKDALSNFNLTDFDLVLMDIQMPVMDGITATKAIKTKYKNPPVIIGLSANAFEGAREKYISLGMDEFLEKPFNTEDFQKIVHSLFAETG